MSDSPDLNFFTRFLGVFVYSRRANEKISAQDMNWEIAVGAVSNRE